MSTQACSLSITAIVCLTILMSRMFAETTDLLQPGSVQAVLFAFTALLSLSGLLLKLLSRKLPS